MKVKHIRNRLIGFYLLNRDNKISDLILMESNIIS